MTSFASRVGMGAVVSGVLSMGVLVTDAAAAPLGCGDVVTARTTLTADIGPCAHGGLVVGADKITLNLNGHRIFGTADNLQDGVGVQISGRRSVTVENGRITDFEAGVSIEDGASRNTVRRIVARDNIGGGQSDFGDGIAVSASSENVIRDNTLVHNGPFDGIGLFGPSSQNTVAKNILRENNVSFAPSRSQDDGIRIEGPGAKQNVVRRNVVRRSGLDGIAVFSDQRTGNLNSGNEVRDNTVAANGFGFLEARPGDGIRLFLRANETLVQANQVHANAGSGIRVDSTSNRIVRNDARANTRHADPGSAFDLYDTNPACDDNTWSRNLFLTASPACTTQR